MGTKKSGKKRRLQKLSKKPLIKNLLRKLKGFFIWRGSFWHKLALCLTLLVVSVTALLYGVAQWYINKHSDEPLRLGTTFIPDYAQNNFGLEPRETLDAILSDLQVKRVRLVSYWKNYEPQPGVYDFSGLDWQFEMAQKYGAKVSLAIGLRQPRWPECHAPTWAQQLPKEQWQPKLYDYMKVVIERYKNNPALEDYQLENEFFMTVFGRCPDFDRNRLIAEYELVKKIDPNHPVTISRSNNWVGIPIGKPTPDRFSVSVYKRVWDATLTKRYFEYPQPAWTYAALAGSEELLSGKDMLVHELQAEPWAPNSKEIQDISIEEQFKSMNAQRMKTRISYAKDTGMRTIDLWGAEWWYWLKVKKQNDSVWKVVKTEVAQANIENKLGKKTY